MTTNNVLRFLKNNTSALFNATTATAALQSTPILRDILERGPEDHLWASTMNDVDQALTHTMDRSPHHAGYHYQNLRLMEAIWKLLTNAPRVSPAEIVEMFGVQEMRQVFNQLEWLIQRAMEKDKVGLYLYSENGKPGTYVAIAFPTMNCDWYIVPNAEDELFVAQQDVLSLAAEVDELKKEIRTLEDDLEVQGAPQPYEDDPIGNSTFEDGRIIYTDPQTDTDTYVAGEDVADMIERLLKSNMDLRERLDPFAEDKKEEGRRHEFALALADNQDAIIKRLGLPAGATLPATLARLDEVLQYQEIEYETAHGTKGVVDTKMAADMITELLARVQTLESENESLLNQTAAS